MTFLHPLRSDRWTGWHAAAAFAMAAAGVAATWDAWADILLVARKDEEYSHIFLVPLVALSLVYVRRSRFRHCRPTGTVVGLLIAAVGCAVTSFGFYAGFQSLWHGGAVLVVLGCVLSVLGRQVLFRFFPAIAVLVFLIPVPGLIRQTIALPLQSWTAEISQVALEIFGISVDRSGNTLSINGTAVNIVEACNGLRMVFALILVSYAFSFGLPLRNPVRMIVLLASPLAAIVCNVLRILPTVWVYGYRSHEAGKMFHDYSGWLMLPVSFLMLLGIIKLLKWATLPVMRYTLAS